MLKHYNFIYGNQLIEVAACSVAGRRAKAFEIYRDVRNENDKERNENKRPRELN